MRRIVAYVGVLLALAGCTLGEALTADPDTSRWADLSASAIVGVWRGSEGDRLEFTESGEFYGEDVKYMFAGGPAEGVVDLSQDTATGSGRWELTAAKGAAPDKKSFVELTFDIVANQPTMTSGYSLLGIVSDGAIGLHYDYSGGNQRTYMRCDSCAHLAPQRRYLGTSVVADRVALAGQWKDQHGSILTLDGDGTYTAQDLRFAYIGSEKLLPVVVDLRREPLPSTGTWKTVGNDVQLDIKVVADQRSFGVRLLHVYADGATLTLASYTSDLQVREQYVYRRGAS